ncbi:MAG: Helicase associated domain protein [Candidatus Ornithomonoglobus sp.]
MGIELFKHNLDAYNAAKAMLARYGKAAIIHPTGTGKSFIGFKMAEDNADKNILWLTPSEYIVKTQLENLKREGGAELDNITFITYAKLMVMSETEIKALTPDMIICDELHRLGAEKWFEGFDRLCKIYPNAKMLGLSATHIRYLDNQRDMAEELFDGNIASYITLGEAIVRGILAPPKYVLSVFSYQKQLERYEMRLKRVKSSIARNTGEKYLEAIRRALGKADGLDKIFEKHMTDKHGKYIVFCANREHMDEMTELAPEWFKNIDSKPHIYCAYSDNPETDKIFTSFKEDNSDHLKLLFCIDMLNEGVHVDNVAGVIMLRPTVSPIIYKQQLGRALSASTDKNAVIFDIVNNIENLYSIGAVEEEMTIAAAYYRSLGEEEEIVNEHFEVIDEVRNCRELFAQLDKVISASWELMYEKAKQYYEEYGNLEIPARYKTDEGYSLGSWIFNQKNIRKGIQPGKLTDEQISKLDEIGMVWDNFTDINWESNYKAAKAYYEEHGNLNVPVKYKTKDGRPLGEWLARIRTWERAGIHSKYLTPERKALLEDIGMLWDKLDYYWERNYLAALEYYRENGNLNVPSKYVSTNGIRLGSWISRMRELKTGEGKGTPLTPEQIQRLDDIGMIWSKGSDNKWEIGFREAERYADQHGDLNVPVSYVSPAGYPLGTWVQRQKAVYRQNKIISERRSRLETIGIVWPQNPWLKRYELLRKYYKEHGPVEISQETVVDGVWLGKWIYTQRKLYTANEKLTQEQRRLLEQLPVNLQPRHWADKAWEDVYADAKAYYEANGSLAVNKNYTGKSGTNLANWLKMQRKKRKNNELTQEQIALLDKIGFTWEIKSYWDKGLEYARQYYKEHGDLNMLKKYTTEDGFRLGAWVYAQREAYRSNELSAEKIKALNAIGMVWEKKTTWEINFEKAKIFYETHGCSQPKTMSENSEEKRVAVWLGNQRKCFREGRMKPEQQARLLEIGVDWTATV